MNNEVKEILREIEYYKNEEMCVIVLSQKENKALLDYITNLQQENEKLNGVIETLKETNHLLINQKYKLEYELDALDNKREKAIEYIKAGKTFDNEDIRKAVDRLQNDLLNILNGSDSE